MYEVTIYDEEHGDITETHVSLSFPDAVAYAFLELGTNRGYKVTSSSDGKDFDLTVMLGDMTVARIEHVTPSADLAHSPIAEHIVNACNSLAEGDVSALTTIFTEKVAPAPLGRLWWVADNMAEAKEWEAQYLAAGAYSVELKPEADRPMVDVIITLDRSRAPEILGTEPDAEEWLVH